MEKLIEQMQMDMTLQDYSPKTIKSYLWHIRDFSEYFHHSVADLGEEDIRKYLYHVKQEKGYGRSYLSQAYSAIKLLYRSTLEMPLPLGKLRGPKRTIKLPIVFSHEEVKKLFDSTDNLKHKMVLMVTYSGGLRVNETAHLRVLDIDSKRMQINVRQSKGRKDRYTLLSEPFLKKLRMYWKAYRPEEWLFPNRKGDGPIHALTIQRLFQLVYFHTVFTIPDTLNPLALINQRVIYNILFRAGSETLLELGRDRKHLGGEIGVIATLHTWGQNMIDHPHLHCIVTGGGLASDGKKWVHSKKTKNGGFFFVHVNVLSDLFKKKFIAYLKAAYDNGHLKFEGQVSSLSSNTAFKQLTDDLYERKWVTYCKEPFSGAEKVLEYLGRYIYRVAISNRRLLKLEDDRVTFEWRDYRDGKEKVMILDALEFENN